MNENIDLTKILKDCPKGWKFYSTIFGEVKFNKIEEEDKYPIVLVTIHGNNCDTTAEGKHQEQYDGECTLFPSRDQRDWSKFTAPWYKTEKFDSKTLKPFDKVIARDDIGCTWKCDLFSYIIKPPTRYSYRCVGNAYAHCIPCNDETKHLVGTTEEAPDYYRYWED